MKNVTRGAVAVAALATAQKVVRAVVSNGEVLGRSISRSAHRPGGRSDGADRWHVITVNVPPDRVPADPAPPPLREVPAIQIRTQAAPGGRGTEIAVKSPDAGVGDVRRALREAKSLLETGEVLLPDAPPTTQPTPLNKPLRTVTEHAREEGRL
jgi:hypothetical protein